VVGSFNGVQTPVGRRTVTNDVLGRSFGMELANKADEYEQGKTLTLTLALTAAVAFDLGL